MEAINLFMWGYQRHFQLSIQHTAKELFKALHPSYEVETFLLGIAREPSPDIHPVCLEPEDCGFLPSRFNQLRAQAQHYEAIDPDHGVMAMQPKHQRSINRRLKHRSMVKAVEAVLNDRFNDQGKYHFSGFVPVDQYDVGIVLRLHCQAKEQPYRLPKVHAEEKFGAPHSLVEVTVSEFLRDCLRSLMVPSPQDVEMFISKKIDEYLREAGDRLMETPVWAGSDMHRIYGLFNYCNYIASLTYEKEGSLGSMFVSRDDHKNVKRTITLSEPIPLSNHRAVRKLLQITATGNSLLCDGSNIYGLGKIHGNYDQGNADLFEIRFTQHYCWELFHAEHAMMQVKYGLPRLALSPIDVERFSSDLARIFKGIKQERVGRLTNLALEACQQKHGAILLISPEAKSEATRLKNQSTGIDPLVLTPELLKSMSSIDGALLVDTEGTCFAMGAILDGISLPEGDPSRGARFNSSLRYVGQRENCLALIVSEDGTAEWIPTLRPQVSRKKLQEMKEKVAGLLKVKEMEAYQARKTLLWLEDKAFYLPADLCEIANALAKKLDALEKSWGPVIPSSFQEFKPDPNMSDEYLKD